MNLAAILFLASCSQTLQPNAETQFDKAVEAWDRGDYIQSLEGFKDLLSRQDTEAWFDKIALTTGELYPVTEMAPDGQNIHPLFQ